MGNDQVMSHYMVIVETLKLIATGGIGAAIMACIGKFVVDAKLAKHQADYNQQLEALKLELEKKKTVHKLQFEKEFQLYDDLWKALIDVRSSASITPSLDILPQGKDFKELYEERLTKAIQSVDKASNLVVFNRPFYHPSVSEVAQEVLKECRRHVRRTARKLGQNRLDNNQFDEADELEEMLNRAVETIEEVIRKRIGLLRDAELVE